MLMSDPNPDKPIIPPRVVNSVGAQLSDAARTRAMHSGNAVIGGSRLASERELFRQLGLESNMRVRDALRNVPPDYFASRPSHVEVEKLTTEIAKLRADVAKAKSDLEKKSQTAEVTEQEKAALQQSVNQLVEREGLSHLLTRVNSLAQTKLYNDKDFRAKFDTDEVTSAYVMSIDLRRSTELMLKARQPRLFAEFVSSLARRLREIVVDNFGIFDKFTGDGVLAFFPEFYSGEDAGPYALKAADECHRAFTEHYAQNRHCFNSILKEVGLGIGLDAGKVTILAVGGDFTVVGTPVVYACRMGGAPAGKTFANQPAKEELEVKYGTACRFIETELAFKGEGVTLAYEARYVGDMNILKAPLWLTENNAGTS